MSCCPTCGQPVQPEIRIDLEAGLIGRRGKVVHLTPHEAKIFETLLDAKGRMLPKGFLLDAVYGLENEEPDSAQDALRVRVYRLRKALADLGFVIKTHWGRGYSMTVEP